MRRALRENVEEQRSDAGFTLIEVLLATTLFVFVAVTGFEVLRQLSWNVALMAQRADASTQLSLAASSMRSDALSALAVWKPASSCGDAVEFMQRDAGGTSFVLYADRAPALVRATAPGPMNPCGAALRVQTVVAAIAHFTVTPVAATALATHSDPISGNVDGALFNPGGVTEVAVDSHATDIDGSHILAGNDSVEVTIDADPVVTPIDLVPGNRPSSYTHVLAYTCNGRCEATAPFPEIRSGTFTDCTPGYDFQNSAAYYVPATYGVVPAGNGNQRIVVTSYSVAGGYTFAFAGAPPAAAERSWGIGVWPPAGTPPAGTIADPYPVDYANNAVAARGIAQVAADLGEPIAFSAELTACANMHADPTYHG
jgi:Tfp pilus assembly protein PilV